MRLIFLAAFLLITVSILGQSNVSDVEIISATTIGQISEISRIKPENSEGLAGRIVWTPDGQSIAIVHPHEVLLYSVSNIEQEPVILFQSSRQLTRIAFDSSFTRMALSLGTVVEGQPFLVDTKVSIIDLQTQTIMAEFQTTNLTIALAFAKGDLSVITVDGMTFNFSVWDIPTSSLVDEYDTNQPGWPVMLSATFNDDATLLALGSGSSYNIRTIWDTQTGEMVAEGDYGYSSQLTFSPNNSVLVGASRYGGQTEFWNYDNPTENFTIEYTSQYTLATDFAVDGSLYAQIIAPITNADQYTIQFLNSETGEEISTHSSVERASLNTNGTDMIFSPNGRWLVIYNANSGIQVWGISSTL